MMDTNAGAGLRHAVRCITDTLLQMGIEVVDFVGRAYDPGIAPEVIEVLEDPDLVDGHAIIEETIAPTVIWRGWVVRPGQIIVRHAATKSEGSAGVDT
jgi:hypothetical protein